jgi:hypothetical protein
VTQNQSRCARGTTESTYVKGAAVVVKGWVVGTVATGLVTGVVVTAGGCDDCWTAGFAVGLGEALGEELGEGCCDGAVLGEGFCDGEGSGEGEGEDPLGLELREGGSAEGEGLEGGSGVGFPLDGGVTPAPLPSGVGEPATLTPGMPLALTSGLPSTFGASCGLRATMASRF